MGAKGSKSAEPDPSESESALGAKNRRVNLVSTINAVTRFKRITIQVDEVVNPESHPPPLMSALSKALLGLETPADAASASASTSEAAQPPRTSAETVASINSTGAAKGAGMQSVIRDKPRSGFGPGSLASPENYATIHRAKGLQEAFVLAFSSMENEARLGCFESLAYFQGKMGYVLRTVDAFCLQPDLFSLFEKLAEVTKMLFNLPHSRLWRIDGRNATVLFNNDKSDPQNGRSVPRLGSFAGEISRSKKVVIINKPGADARFKSWQYLEMQKGMKEELGCIVGVGFVDADGQCPLVLEAYGPPVPNPDGGQELTPVLEEGSDGFLLQTLADLAAPAAFAILRRSQQSQISQLPLVLLNSVALSDFHHKLRDVLCETFECLDAEIFLVKDPGLAFYTERPEKASDKPRKPSMQRSQSTRADALVVDPQQPRKIVLSQKSLVTSTYKALVDRRDVSRCRKEDDAQRAPDFDRDIDGGCANALTGIIELDDTPIGVIQLRNRRWRSEQEGPDDIKRYSGFLASDVQWWDVFMPHVAHAILAAKAAHETQKRRFEARLADQQAKAIMDITACIARCHPIDELFAIVVQEVIRLLNCDRATMWLPEKDGVRLYSLVQAYPPKINAKPMHIGVPLNDKSIVGSCMVNNQMINIQDAYEDDRFNSASDKVTGYHTRSILSFPIFEAGSDKAAGCLQCLNKLDNRGIAEGMKFELDDERLATTFASLVLVAIKRAQPEKFASVDKVCVSRK